MSAQHAPVPWYREPWPWILMAAPAAAVLGGIVMIWLALASADGLVADDYYKRGLAINKVLAREEAARARGIGAEVSRAGDVLRVRVTGASPEALFVRLVHATRSGHDARLRLARTPAGDYAEPLPPLAAGHWRLVIEDPRGEWRIVREGLPERSSP